MFAVPGWSVSADSLKAEEVRPAGDATGSKPRKRKRAAGGPAENVNASNVSDLYDTVVAGKKPGASGSKKATKRQKKGGNAGSKTGGDDMKKGEEDLEKGEDDVKKEEDDMKKGDDDGSSKEIRSQQEKSLDAGDKNHAISKKDKKNKKMQKQDKKQNGTQEGKPESGASKTEKPKLPEQQTNNLNPTPKPTLTPLQASMKEKLISARFRHLNEALYTRPSDEASRLFQDTPGMFEEYHEGFRRQVKVWPENPVDSFLGDIRTRAKVRAPGRARPGGPRAPAPSQLAKMALPRTAGTCLIADLGCGDARLADSLQAEAGKLRLDVKSYDLQSPSALVTKADIANLPLEDDSVNVAIFCLALMGTNWIDFIEEAYRILHWKGELWIAEIKSRFAPARRSKNAPVSHSVGNRKKAPAKTSKTGEGEGDAANGEDLAVEVDGNQDHRRETDVSAFVEVLSKRGFVLQGERSEAVDLSNRMFVKMHFIKGASPSKGKGVKTQEGPRGKKAATRWPAKAGEAEEDIAPTDEASILKPCLYRIR